MLIFVIPSSYPNHINPQASIFVHEQCVALKKAGHEVVVLDATSFNWRYWTDKSCYRSDIRSFDGVTVYSKHIPSILMNKLYALTTIRFNNVITKLFKKAIGDFGMPDLIYGHFTYPSGYVASLLAGKYKLPLMVMEHGGVFMNPKVPKALKSLLKKTTDAADIFACVSEAQKNCILNCLPEQKEIMIINNMIDDRFTYHPVKSNECFTFFIAGNLYKVKRMDLLINAFINTFSEDEKVLLKIAGEGEERQLLESIIAKNQREHQIKIFGRLSREEILEEYINCNAFSLVSEHESFGIAFREAMAVGRPVISSDNGGISTGWSDEYGIIVPLNDVNALSKALRNMYDNYNSYNFVKISEDCIKNYSSENVIKNITEKMEIIVGDER